MARRSAARVPPPIVHPGRAVRGDNEVDHPNTVYVDYCDTPRIRIYDGADNDWYFFRKVGFGRRSIADD